VAPVDAGLDERDAELLAELARTAAPGRKAVLARLLAPYEQMVEGITAARLWRLGRDAVEEGVQRVYEDLLTELESGKTWDLPFRAVVAARIEYTARDVRRDYASRDKREQATVQPLGGPTADTADEAVSNVTLERLRNALGDDEWQLVQATWVEGRSSREVAAELGTTEGALNTRKSRIKSTIDMLLSDG
jgi:RNA polymerase sigma factor (sigma-70 family)